MTAANRLKNGTVQFSVMSISAKGGESTHINSVPSQGAVSRAYSLELIASTN